MEHGNNWDSEKNIEITIFSASNSIKIQITDNGEGFDSKNVEFTKTKKDALGPRGRGIYIIHQNRVKSIPNSPPKRQTYYKSFVEYPQEERGKARKNAVFFAIARSFDSQKSALCAPC